MQNAVHWFEIPVADITRAQTFYAAMLGAPLRLEPMGEQTLAVLPYTEPGVGGALICGPKVSPPGAAGAIVYLAAEPDLDSTVQRALAAGAELLVPRVDLPSGMGAFVHIRDLDGNRIGLHAAN